MNGMSGSRRLASPVRLALNPCLGGDIDGAWWPHSFALAGELPELIEALHPVLGEVLDIKINWSAASGTAILKNPEIGRGVDARLERPTASTDAHLRPHQLCAAARGAELGIGEAGTLGHAPGRVDVFWCGARQFAV